MFKDLTKAYLKWGISASQYWSSYALLLPYEEYFYFTIGDALFVGNEEDGGDYWSFFDSFEQMYPNQRIAMVNETFDTFWEKATHQTPEAVYPSHPTESLASFLLNDSMAQSQSSFVLHIYFLTHNQQGGINCGVGSPRKFFIFWFTAHK